MLIVTSVGPEHDAVVRGLNGDKRFEVLIGGVGPVSAAASTARALAGKSYELVICAGIAGGFAGQAEMGSVIVANEIIAADLGAQTPDGFCSIDELGFGSARIAVDAAKATRVTEALRAAGVATGVRTRTHAVDGYRDSRNRSGACQPHSERGCRGDGRLWRSDCSQSGRRAGLGNSHRIEHGWPARSGCLAHQRSAGGT
ncbi:UNVERIFIED_CONTAM: futalosine hydrolase [Brevibacillus sp. OAP136]